MVPEVGGFVKEARPGAASMMRKIKLTRTRNDRLDAVFASDLNAEQRAAATAPDGFNLILAGPGSGKTRVITYRVAHLIARGAAPDSILLATFTRRAARDMTARLEHLVGPSAIQVWAGTFHHIGNRLLRRHAEALGFEPNFTILDVEDQKDVIKLAMAESGLLAPGRMGPSADQIRGLISLAFNTRRPLDAVIEERAPALLECAPLVAAASQAYAERKRAANCMDYDDLLGHWSTLILNHDEIRATQAKMFRHILIDEMQDTNAVQVELVETLARAGAGNLTAVGDDAQSIYKFRGANYDNILKFHERNPAARIFKLEINYRSTPEIVAFTNDSIARNVSGFRKTLVSARGSGPRPLVVATRDVHEEADFLCEQFLEMHESGIPLGRIAVLYRNHHDGIILQAELVARGIKYTIRSGMRFFEQAHIKDVLSYLRVIENPRDEPAWRRLLMQIPGVGDMKAAAICKRLAGGSADAAFESLESAETMAMLPPKSKGAFAGLVADLRKMRATSPLENPSAAIAAILQGGFPEYVRLRYERAENRLADIDQLAILASRYDRLERLIGDLMLAGDLYGMDTLAGGDPDETLVLSSIHQAKGLEWSRVFVPRLVEDSFPNARALDEPSGEDEERRIFYVAITRAMDELTLTYPQLMNRGARGPTYITSPSRFISEVNDRLYENAIIDNEADRLV